MTASPEHTPLHGRRVHDPIHRGTGLWQASTINGRPATDDELAAMERAYQTGRDRDAALVRVAGKDES